MDGQFDRAGGPGVCPMVDAARLAPPTTRGGCFRGVAVVTIILMALPYAGGSQGPG